MILTFLFWNFAARAEMNCQKPEDVMQMNKEIISQFGCTTAGTLSQCNSFLGLEDAALGGALLALRASGSLRARTPVPGPPVCGLRTSVQNERPLWSQILPFAYAADCISPREAAEREILDFRSRARNQLMQHAGAQQMQTIQHMEAISNELEYQHRTDVGGRDPAVARVSRNYLQNVESIEARHMPDITRELRTLVTREGENGYLRGALAELESPDRATQYRGLDKILDHFKFNRPDGRTISSVEVSALANDKQSIMSRVHKLLSQRANSLRQIKLSSYEELGRATKLRNIGLDASPLDTHEYKSLISEAAELRQSNRLIYTAENTAFQFSNYFDSRYPMTAADPRVGNGFQLLRESTQALSEIGTGLYAVGQNLNAALKESVEKAAQAMARLNAPITGDLATTLDQLKAKAATLLDGKGWKVLPEQLAKMGLQGAASGLAGARHAAMVGKKFIYRGAGPLGVYFMFIDTASAGISMALPTSVNCQTPCSDFLTYTSDCQPAAVMNEKTQNFLKLTTEVQMAEFKKCPAMCELITELYMASSPTENWRGSCATAPQTGIELKSKNREAKVVIDSLTPSKTVRFENFLDFANNRSLKIENGTVASVRVPKPTENRGLIEKTGALTDPNLYDEVPASAINQNNRAHRHVQQARATKAVWDSLKYATAEVSACCMMAKGDIPSSAMPGIQRCAGYGIAVRSSLSIRTPAASGGREAR